MAGHIILHHQEDAEGTGKRSELLDVLLCVQIALTGNVRGLLHVIGGGSLGGE